MAHAEQFQVEQFAEHTAPQYQGIGAELRNRRIQAGHDLDRIAGDLRIRHAHLLAIEEGRFEDLPGPAYATGFLRSYGSFLGLSGEAVLERYREEVSGASGEPDLRFPEPPAEGWMPRMAILAVSIILAGAVFGGWYYLQTSERVEIAEVSEVPEAMTAEAGGAPAIEALPAMAEGSPDPPATTTEDPLADAPAGPAATALAAGELPSDPTLDSSSGAMAAEAAAVDLVPVAVEPVTVAEIDPLPAAVEMAAIAEVDEPPAPETPVAPVAEPIAEPLTAAEAAATFEPAVAPELGYDVARDETADLGSDADFELDVPAPVAAPLPMAVEEDFQAPAPVETAAVAEMPEAPTLLETPAPPPANGDYEPRVYGDGNSSARVVLLALTDSWVQVQSRNNELLLTRILRAGDTYRVPDREDLTLITGNAGGLQILVDGQPMPSLGPAGAVRRNISLSPETLIGG